MHWRVPVSSLGRTGKLIKPPNNVRTHTQTHTHTKVPHARGSTLWHRARAREPILTAQESDAQREQLRTRDLIRSLNERAAELAESRFQHEAALRAAEEAGRHQQEEAGRRQQERQQQQLRLSQLSSLGVPYTLTSTSSRGARILKSTLHGDFT